MKTGYFLGAAVWLAIPTLHAQEPSLEPTAENIGEIDEITVTSARQRALKNGMLADAIEQTEVIDRTDLAVNQSVVLSEALAFTPGARVNNECSMCGVKRIMLNGLGGQHTTLLLDGLPAHTLVSGFYGPDALSMAGVERIEVARGAGASLTAPEAIGGSVNIITQEPSRTGGQVNFAGGETGYIQGDAVGTFVNQDGTLRALFAFQYDKRDQFDADDNGVSESPFLENYNYSGRISFDPTPRSTLTLRGAYTDSEIFGGPVIGELTDSIEDALASFAIDPTESASLFVNDNVNNLFIGKPWETTEQIATNRKEVSGRYFHELTDKFNFDAGVSWSEHKQDSFYEGFDYRADNEMLYITGRFNWSPSDTHLFTIGYDRRDETLRSESDATAGDPAYISDSFDYLTQAIFLQDTWTPIDPLEVSMALRIDFIEADFIDPQRPGTEIDETIVSPRIDIRYAHSDQWTSRLSYGKGYRAPLSFFETDHGILDAGLGFQIDVDRLERSNSVTYALSYLGDRLSWTAGAAWTQVDNLAALDETAAGIPLLVQRDEKGEVYGGTFDLGYALTDTLDLTFTAEKFEHDDVARSIFGVAPIEERIIAAVDWRPENWLIRASYSWIGPRDLTDYGYEGFDDASATFAKQTTGTSYGDLDMRAEYATGVGVSLYLGARNLLNATQVEDETSPLFFDADGGYDVAYIFGPLRGREIYGGARWQF